LTLRDGTGDMQAVVSKKAVGDDQFALSASLTQESSLIVTGQLRQDHRAPGGYELDVRSLEALQIAGPLAAFTSTTCHSPYPSRDYPRVPKFF
jgi:asparaginyl-tRNA synthetase